MNRIIDILKDKRRNKLEESIYETYKRTLCTKCNNKNNDKDLCKITRTQDNKTVCFSYERCMKNQCKTCKNREKCKDEYRKNRY